MDLGQTGEDFSKQILILRLKKMADHASGDVAPQLQGFLCVNFWGKNNIYYNPFTKGWSRQLHLLLSP